MLLVKNMQFSSNQVDILPKMTGSWVDNFVRISAWWDEKCRFFSNSTFLSSPIFYCSYFTYLYNYNQVLYISESLHPIFETLQNSHKSDSVWCDDTRKSSVQFWCHVSSQQTMQFYFQFFFLLVIENWIMPYNCN